MSALSRITGMARSTIGRGLAESGARRRKSRRVGVVELAAGGRNTSGDATLLDDLRELVEPATRGDPQAPLLWTSKSQRHLAAASGGCLGLAPKRPPRAISVMDPRVKAVIYPRPHQPTRNIASEKQRLARDLTEPVSRRRRSARPDNGPMRRLSLLRNGLCAVYARILAAANTAASTTNSATSFAADPVTTSTFQRPAASVTPALRCASCRPHDQQNSSSAPHRKWHET